MVDYPQKIFTIHFPHNKVYIENTCKSLHEKMEYIKNNKDHLLYTLLKEYPNPEVRFERFIDEGCNRKSLALVHSNKKLVALEYSKDNYEILNLNLIPPPRFNLFQTLYKWITY